ncbi:hypothetical protein PAXRUDRAFT_822310 [Paxillus rubicundulus Ve08.2h10]|uniref:Uncharacterized protein n=1 Tax=Paxillus rubicundulus Ve08.2h10 TaxID=930991 RepID=A0A0D0ECS1_9AGAM|nr:hypothetical protein PAXRUDRAFT_822310 [Paxillus rubicundulus Ve08.2h10]
MAVTLLPVNTVSPVPGLLCTKYSTVKKYKGCLPDPSLHLFRSFLAPASARQCTC